jgi:hypothetical protein
MHFDLSVVADQSQLTKFVQEKAHPGSGRSDHFRQSCLTDRSIDWRWLSIFSEIGQQKKKAPAGGRAKAKPAMVSVSRLAWVPGIACQVIKSVLHSINSQPCSRFSKLQVWRWKNGGRFGCPSAEFPAIMCSTLTFAVVGLLPEYIGLVMKNDSFGFCDGFRGSATPSCFHGHSSR